VKTYGAADSAPFDEERISAAIARVLDPKRRTRGTGFLVSSTGTVLTCEHVVAGLNDIEIQMANGDLHRGFVAQRFPDLDLALLACPRATRQPLSLALTRDVPRRFWSKGFQYSDVGLTAGLPITGKIDGLTRVAEYKVGLFALSGTDINPGMSGAPVVDPEWGVVIGVINTQFKKGKELAGFALPVAVAAEASQAIADLVADNRRAVPSYGPFLNVPAASAVCGRSLEVFVATLKRDDDVSDERYCARLAIATTVTDFLGGNAPLLAIVGRTGVGKTMEMSRIARARQREGPTLALVGRSIGSSAENGLAAALEAHLREIAPEVFPKESALPTLVSALRGAGQALVVLVAGLNDAPAVMHNEKHWMSQTLRWLRETGARLVVTCRPEFWDRMRQFVGSDLVYRPKNSSDEFIRLEDFTTEEAESALRAYGLDRRGLSARDVQHPFLVKVYADMSLESPGTIRSLSRYEALDRFIDVRCKHAAMETDLPTGRIRRVLSEAAKTTLGSEQMMIGPAAFEDVPDRLMPQLVKHGLLVPAGESFRFAFDQVGAFLESTHVVMDRARAREYIRQLGEVPGTRAGPLLFALLRTEEDHGSSALTEVLMAMLDVFEQDGGAARDDLLVSVFLQSGDAGALALVLERYLRVAPRVTGRSSNALSVLLGVDLSATERVRLLRILAPFEVDAMWDRINWASDTFLSNSFAQVAAKAVDANAVEAFTALQRWLSDTTRLRSIATNSKIVTVSDIARALLYSFRDRALETLCELLADADGEGSLLEVLARQYPERVLSLCDRWISGEVEKRLPLAAALTRAVLEHSALSGRVDRNAPAVDEWLWTDFATVARTLDAGTDYVIDVEHHSVSLTESGRAKAYRHLGRMGITSHKPGSLDLEAHIVSHYLDNALRAKVLFRHGSELDTLRPWTGRYIVEDGKVVILDEITGLPTPGRRWDDGVQQAVEAKERLTDPSVRILPETEARTTSGVEDFVWAAHDLASRTRIGAESVDREVLAAHERALTILGEDVDQPAKSDEKRDHENLRALEERRRRVGVDSRYVGTLVDFARRAATHARDAAVLAGRAQRTKTIERAREIMRALLRARAQAVRQQALAGLMSLPETRGEVVGPLLQRFRAKDPAVSAGLLAMALDTNFSDVFQAFTEQLHGVADRQRKKEILVALTDHAPPMPRALDLIAEELERLSQSQPLDMALESALSGARLALMGRRLFWSISKRSGLDRQLQEQMFIGTIQSADDRQAVGLIALVALLERQGNLAHPLDWALDQILARRPVDPASFEWALVVQAVRSRHIAESLADRLLAGAAFRPSHAALNLLQLLQGGGDPHEAAREVVMRDRARYVRERRSETA
jgi:hypothetical protein